MERKSLVELVVTLMALVVLIIGLTGMFFISELADIVPDGALVLAAAVSIISTFLSFRESSEEQIERWRTKAVENSGIDISVKSLRKKRKRAQKDLLKSSKKVVELRKTIQVLGQETEMRGHLTRLSAELPQPATQPPPIPAVPQPATQPPPIPSGSPAVPQPATQSPPIPSWPSDKNAAIQYLEDLRNSSTEDQFIRTLAVIFSQLEETTEFLRTIGDTLSRQQIAELNRVIQTQSP